MIQVVVPVSGPFKADGMKVNPYPVVGTHNLMTPWSIHRVNLSRLPILDMKAKKINQWLNPHIGSTLSTREKSLRKKHKDDALMFVKDTIHSIFTRASGIQGGAMKRVFSLQDDATKNSDTIFFVNDIRFDLHSHTIICDAYVLPLTRSLVQNVATFLGPLVHGGDMVNIAVYNGEMQAWKQLLPALVERCRSSWEHGPNCEYKSQGKIPLSETMENDPLCSCGRGKDVDDMSKVRAWSQFAPFVTRIALSPLFAVSYLETVLRDPELRRCFVCRKKGNPKLKTCTKCQKVRYCGPVCQKRDWKVHKLRCIP